MLAAAGLGYQDILKTTIFVTDLKDFAAVNQAYGSYFASEPPGQGLRTGGRAAPGRFGGGGVRGRAARRTRRPAEGPGTPCRTRQTRLPLSFGPAVLGI